MARYRKAYEAMHAGQWLEARRLLLGLWNRARTYDVAASLGQVEYQLLNFVAAARYMSFAIDNIAPKEKYENLERYRAALEEIRAWVGTLAIESSLRGAEIRVDGEFVGRAPLRELVFVAPGKHVIEASGANGKLSKEIAIAAGERLSLAFQFPASAIALPTSAETGVERDELRQGLDSESRRDRAEPTRRNWVPAYVGAGVAVTGLLAAAGFGIAANSAESDANELRRRVGPDGCSTGRAEPEDCSAAADAVDRQRRNATLSTIGVGVAAVAASATIAYIVLWPTAETKKTEPTRSALALEAGPGSLRLSGSF